MQNVNLYSAEKPASAGPSRRQMLALAGALLFVCALQAAYSGFQLRQGAEQLRLAEQAASAAELQLTSQQSSFVEPQLDPQLPLDLAAVQASNLQLQRLVDYLQLLAQQQGGGFVAPLQALSERHPPAGLWLNRIDLHKGGEELRLQGLVQDQELLPLYLHSLGLSEAFRGREFARFDLQRNPVGLLSFSLSSTLDQGESADE